MRPCLCTPGIIKRTARHDNTVLQSLHLEGAEDQAKFKVMLSFAEVQGYPVSNSNHIHSQLHRRFKATVGSGLKQ